MPKTTQQHHGSLSSIVCARERERERCIEKREKDGVPKREWERERLRIEARDGFSVLHSLWTEGTFSCSERNGLKFAFGVWRKKREENGGKIPRRKKTKKVCYHDSFLILVSWCLVVHWCKFPSPSLQVSWPVGNVNWSNCPICCVLFWVTLLRHFWIFLNLIYTLLLQFTFTIKNGIKKAEMMNSSKIKWLMPFRPYLKLR